MKKTTKSKIVYLTFDDGPNEPYTTEILDILEKNKIKATFFVCGKNVEKFPDTAKRIVKDGHAIGDHTYSHQKTFLITGHWQDEIKKTQEIIHKKAGKETFLFRSSWGLETPQLAEYLKENNFKSFRWDVDALDWDQPPAEKIAKRIINHIKANQIILLHDGGGTYDHVDRSRTVLALPIIIQELKDKGFKFKKLS